MNGLLPVVDLRDADAAAHADAACRDVGFFYVVGHGVDDDLQRRLEDEATRFFSRPDGEKAAIAMARGGTAWRGWFPVGGELTSGVPDHKEGIYFGAEEPPGHPLPLHGPNLFASDEMREVVLAYLDAMTALGHRLAALVGVDEALTREPTVLFRIFHYPPGDGRAAGWGVGEHTDYGLLTILRQDDHAGLQVKAGADWIDAPPVPGSFVVNIGDMLERLTGGVYRSTPHRVRTATGTGRLSFPFFFDPSWDAVVPVPEHSLPPAQRWDGADPSTFEGTYGDYLVAKVAKVFPALASSLPRAADR